MAKKDMHRLHSRLVESQFKPMKMRVAAALVYHNITGKTRTAASGQEYEAALADTAIALSQVADLYYTNAQGRLTQETLVWSAGMREWAPARTVPALAALFGGPPPLPR